MAFLENIKKYLAVKSIQKVLANQDRESQYPDFSTTKSLLILFKSEENEKNKFIRSIVNDLRNQGKKVTVWGYLDKKETETAVLPDFRLFSNSELNFYKIPKPLLTEEFIQVEYDMVLQLSNSDIFALDFLLAKAKSPFKVSKTKPYKGISDFMIEVDQTTDDEFLYKQMMHYLNSIKAKK
jgi:hypothetical protein